MKICLAQTASLKGRVQENIQHHIHCVERAIKLQADVIIFPELSITGYEPKLAQELATDVDDEIFNPFQVLSNKNSITIGVGMPVKGIRGIKICMLIFQPNKPRISYAKKLLHDDELPYFIPGDEQIILTIKEHKIAFGICYETLQREHFIKANQDNVDVYIASVAKSEKGINQAYLHYASISKEFNTSIIMVNGVGYCDDFLCSGQSAVWNNQGEMVKQLDKLHPGLLVYDTTSETGEVHQKTITKGQVCELDELFGIYMKAKFELERNGIYQWTTQYPTKSIIENDLRKGVLYLLKDGHEIIGAINISEEQETVYESVPWQFDDTKVLVIHRLVVNPKHQGKGNAQRLMDFAENYAVAKGYSSIRLDAYSQNTRVLSFYNKRQYYIRGDVKFPGREFDFHCMEKEIVRTKA